MTSDLETYFFHDFETGGYEGTSLLSYYACITDESFNVLDSIECYFRPEDGIYKVEAQALAVNKINLVQHDKKAALISAWLPKIEKFVDRWRGTSHKLYIVGHNVNFDNKHLEGIIGPKLFRRVFHRHVLDTGTLAVLLKIQKKLPENFEISLGNLADHFGVGPEERHEAKADVETTIALLQRMLAC
jgi:DNA polymerase III alpha subunit (gram-positive type)